VRKLFLFIIFFLLPFYLFPKTSQAKDYYFPNVKAEYTINQDGSIDVLESRTYKFDGSFSWADITIPLAVTRKGYDYKTSIKNFRVVEAGKNIPTTSNLQDGNFYAKWTYTALDETRTFDLSYTSFAPIPNLGYT